MDSVRKNPSEKNESGKIIVQSKLLEKKNFSVNSRGEPTKVLIVDDSAFNFIVLKKLLALY